jgi:hypothetical protein
MEFLNLGVKLSYKVIHPLHEVMEGQLLDYNTNPHPGLISMILMWSHRTLAFLWLPSP